MGRERHLMWPITIDGAFAELTFAIDHGTPRRTMGGLPPALTAARTTAEADARHRKPANDRREPGEFPCFGQ
jgi:hypothetical protein